MFIRTKESQELKNLGLRVYSNKMIVTKDEKTGEMVNTDEKDILAICNKTFGQGTPTTDRIEKFNQFLVETAEVIAEPKVDYILSLLADFQTAPAGTVKMYKIPKTVKPKWLYTAKGTGTDLVRIDGSETSKIATPQSMTYGATYEILTFMADPIRAFREAVDALATAKVEYYFSRVFELMQKAVANGQIPANNIASGSNLILADFQKVENTMVRLTGGRPLFIGDMALINHFANLIPTTQKDLLTDEVRDMLREELIPSKISKTASLAFPNTWLDEKNSKVRFEPKQGFMFPGGISGKKPFAITEFGATRQYSKIDSETEQVNLKVVFESDITLLNARYIGSVLDNSIIV